MYTKEDIEKAKQYLDNEGYGTGSNFTLNAVANLMAEYAAKNCVIPDVRQRAFSWWNKLTPSQKRDYENKTYSAGEWYEDNSLCDDDIIHMYKKWILHVA